MEQTNKNFALKYVVLLLAISTLITSCGGSDKKSSPAIADNTAPTLEDGTLTVKSGNTKELQLRATDAENDALTYSIDTAPTQGTAQVDSSSGLLSYNATSTVDGTYTIGVKANDGAATATASITITVENTAPKINGAVISMPTANHPTYQTSGSDYDDDSLTYTITTTPVDAVNATIDSTGLITFTNFASSSINYSNASLVVQVSDGDKTHSATINLLPSIDDVTANANSFKNMFYKVTNPETTNSQIVHYDYDTEQQTVIKTNVILGSNVFVMSGNKNGDATTYTAREYGIYHDPSANAETRTAPDGTGGTFEYQFYTDHKLTRFSASNTGTENLIFEGSPTMLGTDLDNAGIKKIDSTVNLFLNETDINNSYVQLKAYDQLADVLKSEVAEDMLHLPLTVRLSDSAVTQGRPLAIVKDGAGLTTSVLVNFIAPHKKGQYPTDTAKRKRLQSCTSALSTCTDVASGDGHFFLLAENTAHVYLAKDGENTIYAYDKSATTIAPVTGISYPAVFDHHHHLVSTSGHGSSGLLSDFTSLGNIRRTLSEGATSYIAINYDLDTNTPFGSFFSRDFYMYKHAQILKITGTAGTKVFDNGDGIDHGDNSDTNDTTMGEHISLTAVKDGKIFLELATNSGNASLGGTCTPNSFGMKCSDLRQGWLDTTAGSFPKADLDKQLGSLTGLNYLLANRIPSVAIGDSVYFTIWDTTSSNSSFSGQKIYHIYKMPLNDISLDLPATPTANGRMFYERTAFRSNGIYEGNVILWDAITSKVTNGDASIVLGLDSNIEQVPDSIVNVMPKSSSNNVTGIGSIFGVTMSTSHGGTPYLTAGEASTANSLRKVNHIKASWIID